MTSHVAACVPACLRAGVSACVVVGDRQKYLVALLTLELDTINSHATERGRATARPLGASCKNL